MWLGRRDEASGRTSDNDAPLSQEVDRGTPGAYTSQRVAHIEDTHESSREDDEETMPPAYSDLS